jgi:hypothetical protein
MAAGLGLFEENTKDTELMIPSPPSIGSMRLLNEQEQERLMNRSEKFRNGWFQYLSRPAVR